MTHNQGANVLEKERSEKSKGKQARFRQKRRNQREVNYSGRSGIGTVPRSARNKGVNLKD